LKIGAKTLGVLQDYPAIVNAAIVALVALQAVIAQIWGLGDWPARLVGDSSYRDANVALCLGVAGLTAMTAGFAGVIVVFGLSTSSDRFRILRVRGGSRLRANWTSVVATGFCGAFLALLAAATTIAGSQWAAMWILEAAALLALHAAVRLLWLLRTLADVVGTEDREVKKADDVAPLEAVFRNKSA
jgi:hypothetical protein